MLRGTSQSKPAHTPLEQQQQQLLLLLAAVSGQPC
jgi:hypothetical protein